MIEIVTENNFEYLLALMKRYQEFYKVENIDESRNRKFFSQFLAGTELGVQFLSSENGTAVSFATVYFTFASSIAAKVAVLSDLFTVPEYRGCGHATKLINHCVDVAKKSGCRRLQWLTQHDNVLAQSLYNKMCTYSGQWVVYSIDT